MPKSTILPNLKFLTTHVPNVQKRFQNLQIWHGPITPSPPLGYFVIKQIGHVQDMYSAYKISSYTRSKLMKGDQSSQIWPLEPTKPPQGKYFVIHEVEHAKITSVQNLKFQLYPFQINQKGSQIYKFGPCALLWGYFVICAPLPPSWTEEKEKRRRMEGMAGG